MFLTGRELNQMRLDFERLLVSPEATTVTLAYRSTADTTIEEDEVYQTPILDLSPGVVTAQARCIHDVPNVETLKKYPGGLIKEGMSVFYFSTKLNLAEPKPGFPVALDSLVIIDALGERWKPKLINGGLPAFHHLFRVGQHQIAQAIACVPEK